MRQSIVYEISERKENIDTYTDLYKHSLDSKIAAKFLSL